MMADRCSREISTPCSCGEDAPRVGTPLYAERRAHPDAGDLEALRIITGWIKDGGPCMHLRFADGEFYSIIGQHGKNSDGLEFQSETLGRELHTVLIQIASGAARDLRLLVGGDWTIPEHESYVWDYGLERVVPWCPSSIWVNGVVSGELARFFEALLADPRPRVLVGNNKIRGAAAFMCAKFIEVPESASWSVKREVEKVLSTLGKDSIVLYCAGMSTEVFAWDTWRARKDLTHLDMGHIFDGAFGVLSRNWLQPEGKCRRRDTYFAKYAPVFRGETTSFGNFE